MSPWAALMDCCAVFRDSASRTCAAISDCSALHRSRNSRFFRPVRRKETRARGWDREFESCFFLQRGCLSSEPPASTRRTPRFRGARRAHGDVRMGPTVRIRFPPAGSLLRTSGGCRRDLCWNVAPAYTAVGRRSTSPPSPRGAQPKTNRRPLPSHPSRNERRLP
jgi:hypothetical protein